VLKVLHFYQLALLSIPRLGCQCGVVSSMSKQPGEHPKEIYLDEKWDKLLDLS
jgi:hypothetical protein